MRRLLGLVLVLGLAWAQSVQVELKGSLARVEEQVVAALKGQGLEVDRILNLGEQVRQVTRQAFPEYRLVVLKPDKGSLAAVSKNPMAAIVLPPTVYIHTAKEGTVTVGTFDGRLLFSMLGVMGPETEALVAKLEAALAKLGPLSRIPPAVMPDPKGGMMPALLYLIEGTKAEEATLLVEGELTARGLNLTPNVKVGPVTVIMPCKSEWARIMFTVQPAGGFAAPCRFFAMDTEKGALVGAIEPMLMTIMPGVQGSPAVAMLQEARQTMVEILEAIGGKPYTPSR